MDTKVLTLIYFGINDVKIIAMLSKSKKRTVASIAYFFHVEIDIDFMFGKQNNHLGKY